MQQTNYYRAIWISDVHLGTSACKAESLLDFLRHHLAETLYLVGDIVDGWNCGPGWHWSAAQAALVEEIASWRRRGANVVFLPGNHDESNLGLVEELFGRIGRVASLIHRTAAGARMLVIHGHQFDGLFNPNRLLPIIGMHGYAGAQRIHQWYLRDDRRGDRERSLSDFIRDRTRKTLEYLTDFRDRAVVAAAREHNADGVICGHIHRADHRLIGSVWYVNDGDWVQNRTAVVEEQDGSLRLLRWNDRHDANAIAQPMLQEAGL
jgi:UDP-2,3-diacylglucosamine pyrophosphatase LpxH